MIKCHISGTENEGTGWPKSISLMPGKEVSNVSIHLSLHDVFHWIKLSLLYLHLTPTYINWVSEVAHETAPSFLRGSFHWKHILLYSSFIYTANNSDNVPWEHSLEPRPSCWARVTFWLQMVMLFEAHKLYAWWVWWVCMLRQYPAESSIILLWLCPWKHQIEIPEEPKRMVGCSWNTFHTLKYGVKVRRVSWGLWTCWGTVKDRTEQRDSDLVQRNFEKSLLDQSTSWAPSQRENWQVCSKQEFRKELLSLLCAKQDQAWGKSRVKSLAVCPPEQLSACSELGTHLSFSNSKEDLWTCRSLAKILHCRTQSASSVTVPVYDSIFRVIFLYQKQTLQTGFCCLLFSLLEGTFHKD